MILSLSFLSCKDRANPSTLRHRCTPLVDSIEKPDGKLALLPRQLPRRLALNMIRNDNSTQSSR